MSSLDSSAKCEPIRFLTTSWTSVLARTTKRRRQRGQAYRETFSQERGCLTTENKGIYAAVFDMDGVLIDSHPAHLSAWREFLRSAGKEVFDDELSFVLEGRTRSEILRHFLGPLPDRELEQYGRRKDEIFRSLEHRINLIPGVLEFVRGLNCQGIASAVATSA